MIHVEVLLGLKHLLLSCCWAMIIIDILLEIWLPQKRVTTESLSLNCLKGMHIIVLGTSSTWDICLDS